MTNEPHNDYLIVGAGISGLLLAHVLQLGGAKVALIEKSKGVGGRMASRRDEQWLWDHGAQYIRFRSERLASLLSQWQECSALKVWAMQFANLSGELPEPVERWIGVQGMTSLPKLLAKDLEIHQGQRVEKIEHHGSHWQLLADSGERYSASLVIVTAPLPQALMLLEASSIVPPDLETLNSLTYAPCLALLLGLSQSSSIPAPGGLMTNTHPVLGWVADNHQKGISTGYSVTVQANPDWSALHYEDDLNTVMDTLCQAVSAWIEPSSIVTRQLMRWRYSLPLSTYNAPFLAVDKAESLWLCGDAFGGPRVEGAMLSALGLAERLQACSR